MAQVASWLAGARVWIRDGGRCAYCRRELSLEGEPGVPEASLDHFVPRSRGGRGTDANLVLACVRCNSQKDSGGRFGRRVWMHPTAEDLLRVESMLRATYGDEAVEEARVPLPGSRAWKAPRRTRPVPPPTRMSEAFDRALAQPPGRTAEERLAAVKRRIKLRGY